MSKLILRVPAAQTRRRATEPVLNREADEPSVSRQIARRHVRSCSQKAAAVRSAPPKIEGPGEESIGGPVHNSARVIGLLGPLRYHSCFTWGRGRWQRPRSSHPARRRHRRGSAARRDAKQRQPASDGRRQPRPQLHGRRIKRRATKSAPAKAALPFRVISLRPTKNCLNQ